MLEPGVQLRSCLSPRWRWAVERRPRARTLPRGRSMAPRAGRAIRNCLTILFVGYAREREVRESGRDSSKIRRLALSLASTAVLALAGALAQPAAASVLLVCPHPGASGSCPSTAYSSIQSAVNNTQQG